VARLTAIDDPGAYKFAMTQGYFELTEDQFRNSLENIGLNATFPATATDRKELTILTNIKVSSTPDLLLARHIDVDPIIMQLTAGATLTSPTTGQSLIAVGGNETQTWRHELVHHLVGKGHAPKGSCSLISYDACARFQRFDAERILDAFKEAKK